MRVALVYPSGHFFDTPCVPNLVEHLAKNEIDIDVYFVNNTATPAGSIENKRVKFHWFPYKLKRAKENVFVLSVLFFPWIAFNLIKSPPDFIIAPGIRSLFIVGILCLFFRKGYAYNSLEIYPRKQNKSFTYRAFKFFEGFFCRRSAFIIIQDEKRADLLKRENLLPGRHTVLLFPNSPFIPQTYDSQSGDLKKARNPYETDKKRVLISGSLDSDWASLSTVISLVEKLNSDTVLFLQFRQFIPDHVIPFQFNAKLKEKVNFSKKPLDSFAYDQLVMSSSVAIAWYEYSDDNIKYVGLSSGKIAHYLYRGIPIIVNNIPLYDEVVPLYKCGEVVESVDEISNAIEKIIANYEVYRLGALMAYKKLFLPEEHAKYISDKLKKG